MSISQTRSDPRYLDFNYVKLVSGAEDVFVITLSGDDGIYDLFVSVLASNGADVAEFNQTLTLQLASGVWSVLQMTILPALLATSGATTWSISIGSIVTDTITLTATSPADVAWSGSVDNTKMS